MSHFPGDAQKRIQSLTRLSLTMSCSMEIGSAYALQVCLLQIPAMVAFSAFYDPGRLGEMVDTFT